jgi:rubrerythrin
MPPADQIRARLAELAAAEVANPSPVWPPVTADDQPDQCPQCGTTRFDFDPNHDDGISMGPAWLCTECRWGVRSVPNPMTAQPIGCSGFTADEIRRCHEATEFDHQCRVCATVESRPDEAIPGTDF